MNLEEFSLWLIDNIIIFTKNMASIEGLLEQKSREEWMDAFIKWMEWKTDEHDKYWKL